MQRANVTWVFLASIVGCGGRVDANASASDAGVADVVVVDAVVDAVVADVSHSVPCTATALTALTMSNAISQIVMGRDGYVYFQAGGVWRVPKSGGKATVVVPDLHNMMYLSTFALTTDSIAWFRSVDANSPSILERTSLDGMTTTDALTLGPGFCFVATAPSHELVWGPSWVANDDPRLHDVHDGVATALAPPASGEVYRATADADGVFFLATPAGVAKRNGDAFDLLDPTPALAVAVDDAYVYFASQVGVQRLDKHGGQPQVVAQVLTPSSIAVDAQNVYFAGQTGRLERVPKNGGSITTLFTGAPQKFLEDVALDDECVYFGVNGMEGGTLFVSPK